MDGRECLYTKYAIQSQPASRAPRNGEEGCYLGLDGADDGYFHDLLKEAARVSATIVGHTENHRSGGVPASGTSRRRPARASTFRPSRRARRLTKCASAIDVMGSDHVPRKRAAKDKGLWQASQGFAGTGTILPVLLSEGYHKGRLSLERVCEVLTAAPAHIFNLQAEELGSYADYSLYDGWKLRGWAVKTIVRATTDMEGERVVGPAGHGKYLSRKLDLGVTSNR